MMNIAFLGPEGSYSYIAALKYASYYHTNHIKTHSCLNFHEIIESVENHKAEYGILPIENSNSGLIHEVCELLLHTSLILVGSITIPIQHRILMYKKTDLQHVRILYSHSQPAQQCSKFLKNFPKWKIIFCNSSSLAIRTVANLKQSHSAALGSIQGGMFYDLQPLSLKTISNYHSNTTRFIILKNTKVLITNHILPQKIMLVLSIGHDIKNLRLILKVIQFYKIQVNFIKLHRCTQNYRYFAILEITADFNNFSTQKALIKIRKISHSLRILGCYSSL